LDKAIEGFVKLLDVGTLITNMMNRVNLVGDLKVMYSLLCILPSHKRIVLGAFSLFSTTSNHMVRCFVSPSQTLGGILSLECNKTLGLNNEAKHPIKSKFGLSLISQIRLDLVGGNKANYSNISGNSNKMGPRENRLMHINHRSIKNFNTIELGNYLAGLWEADGYFSKRNSIEISFNELDVQIAKLLSEIFGHGNVRFIKGKRACVLYIGDKEGVMKFLKLIDGKVRIPSKLQQIWTRIDSGLKVPHYIFDQRTVNTEPLLNSHWLTGFADGDGNFYVQIIDRKARKEVRLHFKVSLKCEYIVHCISNSFGGGYVGKRKHPNGKITYYWSSTSFENAYKVHDYFYKNHLQSTKWLNFLKWRKVLRYVHFAKHTTPLGIAEIVKIKKSMNSKLTQFDIDTFSKSA
jgi:hypothetical protein